jgi:beta-fructofuranosidase
MKKAFLRPEGAWMGDFIPYYEGGVFYIYYLHDPRVVPAKYAEQTTWHLLTTMDFSMFQDRGEAIARGSAHAPNRDIYTGSVLRTQDGDVAAFYTAFNPDYLVDGRAVQSVMVARGENPLSLTTDPTFRMTADGELYEPFDWRDPYVFYHEPEGCYWMLLAARLKGAGAHRGGCIALCKSKDLVHWTHEKPFYAPNMYITMECPEMFRMGDWWYLVFSTFSDRFVTHYRKAKSPLGPWIIPTDDAFDGRANYAIKTASDGRRRYAFGWIATKLGGVDAGSWEWGGDMHVHELVQLENGDLSARPVPAVLDQFDQPEAIELKHWNCGFVDGYTVVAEGLAAVLTPVPEKPFRLDIELRAEASEVGIALNVDPEMENGYFLRIKDGLLALDQWPRSETQGEYQWQIRGDIPFQVETLRPVGKSEKYQITLLREDSILAVYVNGAALSTRAYDHRGGYAGVYAVCGRVEIERTMLWTRSVDD